MAISCGEQAANECTEQLREYYATWTVRFYGCRYTGGEIVDRIDLYMLRPNEKNFVGCEKENFCNNESAWNQFLPASTLGMQPHAALLAYQLKCVKASLVELSQDVKHHPSSVSWEGNPLEHECVSFSAV